MREALEYLKVAEIYDVRQQSKVLHKLHEIIGITFFAMIANANDPEDIEAFCKEHESIMRKYYKLENGIPSHDTIERALAMVSAEYLQEFQRKFYELMNTNEGEKVRKILSLDGKTQCGNGSSKQKANHIVSCVDERGFCLGQELVDEKSNEIKAIPDLLESLNIKGHIVTADAMGTQKDIVKIIRRKKADYVLALKGNQGTLHEDVKLYFADEQLLAKCSYHKSTQKARGCLEIRECWQTDDCAWLACKKDWPGLNSIVMTRNTIKNQHGEISVEARYFISSLPRDATEAARAIRSHWMVESYHWHLDVTFREDDNRTLDKHVAYNLNIFRKLAINLLKLVDVGRKRVSLKRKRFIICCNPLKYFERVLSL